MNNRQIRDIHVHNLLHPIRIKVFENDEMHDIVRYNIDSSKDNEFISDDQGMDFCTMDMQYLIIYAGEFNKIIDKLQQESFEQGYNQGLQEGKKASQFKNNKTKSKNKENKETPKFENYEE
jgi:hypothetical protein